MFNVSLFYRPQIVGVTMMRGGGIRRELGGQGCQARNAKYRLLTLAMLLFA
jgi:hypothetical protein